jgi:predicted nuclease of predicted toxin-antitoxin system
MLRGAPPKVIIIRKGNTKTESLVSLFISQETTIKDFLTSDLESTILEII